MGVTQSCTSLESNVFEQQKRLEKEAEIAKRLSIEREEKKVIDDARRVEEEKQQAIENERLRLEEEKRQAEKVKKMEEEAKRIVDAEAKYQAQLRLPYHIHPLDLIASTGRNCDICGRKGITNMAHCEICDWDECSECFELRLGGSRYGMLTFHDKVNQTYDIYSVMSDQEKLTSDASMIYVTIITGQTKLHLELKKTTLNVLPKDHVLQAIVDMMETKYHFKDDQYDSHTKYEMQMDCILRHNRKQCYLKLVSEKDLKIEDLATKTFFKMTIKTCLPQKDDEAQHWSSKDITYVCENIDTTTSNIGAQMKQKLCQLRNNCSKPDWNFNYQSPDELKREKARWKALSSIYSSTLRHDREKEREAEKARDQEVIMVKQVQPQRFSYSKTVDIPMTRAEARRRGVDSNGYLAPMVWV